MSAITDELRRHGIACDDIAVLGSTDRGDIVYFSTPGGEPAVALWERLRGLVPATAHWPVLLGDEEELERHRDGWTINSDPASDILSQAETIDPLKWLAETETQRADELREYGELDDPADEDTEPTEGWPAGPPDSSFNTPFNLRGKPHDKLFMALVPTTVPWQVFAYLRFGGWNECPESAVHCAVHRHWQEALGSVPFAITGDVVETAVARPPATREDALALARQQCNYCFDIVEQGVETVPNLAAALLQNPRWFFWWD